MTRQASKTVSSLKLQDQTPTSFNDLSSLFEAYLDTLIVPLWRARIARPS